MLANLIHEMSNPSSSWGTVSVLVPIPVYLILKVMGFHKTSAVIVSLLAAVSIPLAFIVAVVVGALKLKDRSSKPQAVAFNEAAPIVPQPTPFDMIEEMPIDGPTLMASRRRLAVENGTTYSISNVMKPRGKVNKPLVTPVYSEGVKDPQRSFTPEERQFIFNRDGNKCVKCGSSDDLQADHIMPHSKFGQTVTGNGQTLCGPCNRSKSATVPSHMMDQLRYAQENA